MTRYFVACTYRGRPAVLDTRARVYYFGFRNMAHARQRAAELNE